MKFNKTFIFLLIFLIFLLVSVFAVHQSLAASAGDTGSGANPDWGTTGSTGNGVTGSTGGYNIPNPLNSNTFNDLVIGIAKWFYLIMVPVASIIVLYAGFLFLTSGGDEEKVKKAKRAITWAIVGIAIILIGAGFVTFVKSLLSVK